MKVETPAYWQEAQAHLAKKDRIMKKLIATYPDMQLESRGEAYTTLARSIVGQQISVKAAQSVWDRFEAACKPPRAKLTPEHVLAQSVETLRGCGLSGRKVEYIQDLSQHFLDGKINPKKLRDMDDEAVIKALTDVRGVGRWTAEMFLMFYLLRPNVLPLDDIGLINGVAKNYFSGEPTTRHEVKEIALNWAPYCSVATWYIWRSLDPIPVAY